MLRPATGEAKLVINPRPDEDTPRCDVNVQFQELSSVLDDKQYHGLLSMVDLYYRSVRQAEYRRYRPSEEEMRTNRAGARLHFAMDTIMRQVREKNQKWTPKFTEDRRRNRQRYQDLYSRKTLRQDDDTALKPLDAAVSRYDDNFAFRRSLTYDTTGNLPIRRLRSSIQLRGPQVLPL